MGAVFDCVDREGFLERMILSRNFNKWRGNPYDYLGRKMWW